MLLEARAEEEARRTERIHAEHRASVAELLREHRDELRARSDADAIRTAELLREILAGHRIELARAAQIHADQLAQVLAQHEQRTQVTREDAAPTEHELRSALIEQARLQREANDDVAEHIGALTSIVADLGQTIGLIAVATAPHGDRGISTIARPESVAVSAAIPGAAVQPVTVMAPQAESPRQVAPATSPERVRMLRHVDDDRNDEHVDAPAEHEALSRAGMPPLVIPWMAGDDQQHAVMASPHAGPKANLTLSVRQTSDQPWVSASLAPRPMSLASGAISPADDLCVRV